VPKKPHERSQVSRVPSRPCIAHQCLFGWLFLATFICGATTLSNAQGYPEGEPAVGSSSGLLVYGDTLLDASQFSGADPCAKIAAAVSTQTNAVIDGRGLGNSGNITPPCALTDANGANFLANATGGFVNLPPATIWVPFAPSAYGTSLSPPTGIIIIPNMHGGMRGTGRSATSGPNSVIAVCTGATTPSCQSPVTREWTIASTGITYLTPTTTTSAETASSTPVNIPVASSTGFSVNFVATIDTVASGVQELEVVTAVPDATHVTVAKLTNNHMSGVLFATNRVYLSVRTQTRSPRLRVMAAWPRSRCSTWTAES
jgi:hypothetical protein